MATGTALQGDDPAVEPVAAPDAEVLGVFVAIDDSAAKLAVEVYTEVSDG